MPQGGPCLGNPGAKSLRTNGAPSYAANTPTHSICCGTLCGPCLPSDGLSGSSCGSASSLCLCMPSFRASYSGIPSMPVSFRSGSSGSSGLHLPTLGAFHGGSSGGIPSLCHASLFAQGSNASGCVVVAFTALPASSTLAVPSVGASVPFTSNDTPPGSCMSITMHLTTPMPAFPATWTGPRPTPPGSSGGSSHRLGGLKGSRRGSAVHHTGATALPGTMLCV